MSKKYFGTDGIRGRVGTSPITPGSSKIARVLNFGVAVKAKKLRFGCFVRFI